MLTNKFELTKWIDWKFSANKSFEKFMTTDQSKVWILPTKTSIIFGQPVVRSIETSNYMVAESKPFNQSPKNKTWEKI